MVTISLDYPVSIHAPRVGSDMSRSGLYSCVTCFNPRSPCGERRRPVSENLLFPWFQSTLPVWGATRTQWRTGWRYQVFQSTLPVWEATSTALLTARPCSFNPRSPCGERREVSASSQHRWRFNPRSPCGERRDHGIMEMVVFVSIHAPRVGSDHPFPFGCFGFGGFNPRSPCGERQQILEFLQQDHEFQSTLPVWGATVSRYSQGNLIAVSIHAPRVGSDDKGSQLIIFDRFVSIHAPRVGSDQVI